MHMKRLLALTTALLVLSGSTSTFAAPQAKSGAKCTKAGSTQTVGGKKFTCVKSGSKLIWNKGISIPTPSANAPEATNATTGGNMGASNPTPSTTASLATTPTPAPSSSIALVKFKNCTEVKAAGAAPLTKAKTPELYELNAGLDRDKDGVACES